MWFIDSFLTILIYALSVPLVFTFVDALWSTKDLTKLVIENKSNMDRWLQGELMLNDIYNLTEKEFKYWCEEFISGLGYSEIYHSEPSTDYGKDITCSKNLMPVYVLCKKYLYSDNAKLIIDETDCRKFIGVMVHDGITKGMIITTGIISTSAISYIRTLPKIYEIELLDGRDILRQYSRLRNFLLQTSS